LGSEALLWGLGIEPDELGIELGMVNEPL